MLSEFQKKRIKNVVQKSILKYNDCKLSKIGEIYRLTDSRSSANLKLDKLKEIHPRYIIIKQLKTKTKKKIFEL